MFRVSKCCFCCNLKYGFFTFAVMSMLYRVSMASALYFTMFIVPELYKSYINLLGVGTMLGWCACAASMLGIALKGIIQKRSILLYPYIVVLAVEMMGTMIAFLYIMCVTIAYWTLVQLLIATFINIYTIICLISLFHDFKDFEKRRPPIPIPIHPEIIRVM